MLLGVLGGRFGFDLGSKIEMSTKSIEIQESMLSPAWEQVFPLVCRCFFYVFDDFHALGWSLRSSGELWRLKLSSGGPGESSGADFFLCVRPIPGFWMLPLRLLVNISSIWEVAGVLLGVLADRFWLRLEHQNH